MQTLTIDLDAIAANWRALDARHAGETAGVLKADAYGLGMARVAPVLEAAGCRKFFTAHLAEAITLRALLPGAWIAVLNGVAADEAAAFCAKGIVPVLGSLADVARWQAQAWALGRALPGILHIDTGMHRLGLTALELDRLADGSLLEGIDIELVMSHLLAADAPQDAANARQLALFHQHARRFPGVARSLANSSGMFLGPEFASDLARPGAGLYGINPMPGQKNPMRDVVRLSAPVLQVHEINAGESVGYGASWRAERPSRIATIGVGYADGYHRALSNRGTAYFDDTPVQLVGRVSMDLCNFDVTDVPVRPGDRLELLGPHHGADALAAQARTNGYEILTSLGRRFARRYVGA